VSKVDSGGSWTVVDVTPAVTWNWPTVLPVRVTCAPNGDTLPVLTRLTVVCAGWLRVMAMAVQFSVPAVQVIVTGWLS